MDKHQKKQIKKYITYGVIALLVLVLAVMPLIASQNAAADGPQASILNTKAELRTIESQLVGGGQLSSNSTEEITIPEEIKLVEYLVGNGDIVKEGDAIATVDKVSVLTALSEVQETLEYLAGELSDERSNSDSDRVKAHAGGLVKLLYGEAGDSVREVMLEHGALAVLSLDGRMAVDIDRNTDLKSGTTVCVYLDDDTEVEGKVESSTGGTLIVSIADDGYAVGEKVTVKTEDGTRLGSGTLYIHNAWNATAYYGTISKVNVKEGDTLSAGKTMFELEVSDYSAQFQILASQRQEYEELMQELFRMYDSGVVTAPCDGIVTGVDEEGAFLLAAEGQQDWQVQFLNSDTSETAPGYRIILLSNTDTEDGGSAPESDPAPTDPPATEATPPEDTPAETTPTETTPVETLPVYSVRVGQVSDDGLIIVNPFTYSDVTDLNTIPTTVTQGMPTESWPLTGLYNKDLTTFYAGTASAGNILFEVKSSDSSIKYVFAAAASAGQQGQPGEMSGAGGMGGAMGGGMGSTVVVFEPYTLETLTIATVTSQEEMTLEITVDEQDIGGLHTGQEATVTVEALTGQSFPATVTSVSNTGTNEGGSSKFTAKLTLSKSGDMLPGMNASAFLTLDTAEQVLSIPAAALVEEGTRTIVYTACSEKDDVLKNPVEVTTGVSDGEYVEILSGLSEGDSVYYAYYDTVEISNALESGRFSFR